MTFTSPTARLVNFDTPEVRSQLAKALTQLAELKETLQFNGELPAIISDKGSAGFPVEAVETLLSQLGQYLEKVSQLTKKPATPFTPAGYDKAAVTQLMFADPSAFGHGNYAPDLGVRCEFGKMFASVLGTFRNSKMLAGMLNNHAFANSHTGFSPMSPGWGPGPQFVPPGFRPMNGSQPNAHTPTGTPWHNQDEEAGQEGHNYTRGAGNI